MEERYPDSSSDKESESGLQDESDHMARSQRRSSTVSRLLLAVIGTALVAVVMVTIWFWERPQRQQPEKRLGLLEQRIEQLEGRIARLDGIDERVMTLESHGQKFMTAVDRLDRFETAVTLRMDIVAKELAELQQAASAKTPPPVKEAGTSAAAKKPTSRPPAPSLPPAEEPAVHTVSAGETLYSISRRYDMSVDELRRANKLDEEATIYPGQKLRVR